MRYSKKTPFVVAILALLGLSLAGSGAIAAADLGFDEIIFVKRMPYSSDHYYTDINNGTSPDRFHPENGQLYMSGMFAWAGDQQQPGGFYRLRYTGKPAHLPVALKANRKGLDIVFTEASPDTEIYTHRQRFLLRVEGDC